MRLCIYPGIRCTGEGSASSLCSVFIAITPALSKKNYSHSVKLLCLFEGTSFYLPVSGTFHPRKQQ